MDVSLLIWSERCDHVWCKKCSKKQKIILKNRLQQFNWRKTRHIRLSLNRNLFESELDAYEKCKNGVAYFIKELKRKYGIKITRWVRVLEFHEDGFLHYHVLVEKADKGYIGQHIIESAWKKGFCREYYFKVFKHWSQFTGYFESHGYFGKEGKGHQDTLPRALALTNMIIRRFVYSENKDWIGARETSKKEFPNFYKRENEAERKPRKINQIRIDNCGMRTKYNCFMQDAPGLKGILNIPTKKMKEILKAEYIDNLGLYAKLYKTELRVLIKEHIGDCELLWQL